MISRETPSAAPAMVRERVSLAAWILRVGVAGCFIGHGAFGVITKSAWLPYFAVGGIGEPLAWALMPWIGAMDIAIGVIALIRPSRPLLAWAVLWATWTALCRPLAGEPFWETLERAGNYGVPLAFLMMLGRERISFSRLAETLDSATLTRLAWTLRLTTATLLVGHAGLGLFTRKPGLTEHYRALWADSPAGTVAFVGAFESALAAAVVVFPRPALLLGIALWKLASESLFLAAGAPIWEVVERAGSYAAPLALAVLLFRRPRATLAPHLAPPAVA